MSEENVKKTAAKPSLLIGVKPFQRAAMNTADCMMMVVFALLPTVGFAVYRYGLQALIIMGVSIGTAFICELILGPVINRRLTILDGSFFVTGLIGALILPPNIPIYYPAVSAAAAIVLGKFLFGGIGRNIFNPAAVGKVVLIILMNTVFPSTGSSVYAEVPPLTLAISGETVNLKDMVFGNVGGFIGTTSAITVLAGALILFAVGVADVLIPMWYMIAFALVYAAFGGYGISTHFTAIQFAGGALLFTAFFMANDFTTSPMSKQGKRIYGILLGIAACAIRIYGLQENACLYGLLLINPLVRLIDLKVIPRAFGSEHKYRRIIHVEKKRTKEELAAREEEKARFDDELDQEFDEFLKNVVPADVLKDSETKEKSSEE